MYKQSPSRNNRTKGSKLKLILQICLLLAVCFWLIYQVKHSHDKKVEFDSEDEKVVGKEQSDADILRLGRKDVPRITETATDVDEHLLEEEEKEAEEEESKNEDDDTDENGLEKAGTESKHEDEMKKSGIEVEEPETGHAHESHADEDNETDENEVGLIDNRTDNEENDDVEDEERSETEDHEGTTNENHGESDVKLEEDDIHEAQEEIYKADDASSVVAHDNQTIMSETGNVTIEDEVNRNITYTNVENVNTTNEVESLISDDTSSLFHNMNGSDTMLVEGRKLEESGTVDSDENADVVPRDPIDASDSTLTQEEKDSRMDLDTLPEIASEAQNNDEAMAE